MRCNDAGREIIKRFEGCRLLAYLDAVGVPTIGYGHTGDVKLGQRISQHQADVIFSYDLERFEDGVAGLAAGVALSSNQFSALVSFAFNVGLGNLSHSTLLKRLRAGDSQAAADQLPRWVKAGGKTLPGLVARRKAERELFLLAD
jgi:lysozyme